MALVNWERVDQEYQKMTAALLKKDGAEKYVSFSKVVAKSNIHLPTQSPEEEWESFMRKNKSAMPPKMVAILETVNSASAPNLTAILQFGVFLAEYWPDVRTEIKELAAHNALLVEERHQFKKLEFQASLK
jgi:hypothetical protein